MIIHHAESTQRKHGMTAAFSERKFLKEEKRMREREGEQWRKRASSPSLQQGRETGRQSGQSRCRVKLRQLVD